MLIDHISSIGFRIMAQILRHGKPKKKMLKLRVIMYRSMENESTLNNNPKVPTTQSVCLKEPVRPSESPRPQESAQPSIPNIERVSHYSHLKRA